MRLRLAAGSALASASVRALAWLSQRLWASLGRSLGPRLSLIASVLARLRALAWASSGCPGFGFRAGCASACFRVWFGSGLSALLLSPLTAASGSCERRVRTPYGLPKLATSRARRSPVCGLLARLRVGGSMPGVPLLARRSATRVGSGSGVAVASLAILLSGSLRYWSRAERVLPASLSGRGRPCLLGTRQIRIARPGRLSRAFHVKQPPTDPMRRVAADSV